MKNLNKALLLVTFLVSGSLSAWSQATPSTEGRDFWVTFLRASENDGGPEELKLTISAKEACNVVIENTSTNFRLSVDVGNNSSTEIGTRSATNKLRQADCYSSTSEQAKYTALHVTATKDISLFAGNYRDKSFDATNVLPTTALLDDYIIQTYPPSDHSGDATSQGSHFAIIAVEDGETTVEYNLTAKTSGGKTGAQSTTLKKGQVFYVWTGKGAGDAADLSGTTVKARNGKKIAVFQGCPHTNIPYTVRDRDHIVSQAMPTAYWGTEFGITASRKHRRDIVAVMAINDGTEVYINAEDGGKRLVHTFDFNKDKKHYWTFEIGESLAYCADDEAPSYGKLPEPEVADSSCYLTTSCPAGVHLFMVSNRYDNIVPKVSGDTLVSDPAMLWISPIEQVIKEINFSTYKTDQAKFHFMNILTTTSNVANMTWNGNNIRQYFHPLMGNDEYSYARIEINEGNHNLKGTAGFLAHVYGYGQRESYAYSCGSSTVQRSISLNDVPLMIDSVSPTLFCVNQDIEMELHIGNNDYESVLWDYGDGITYLSDPSASNAEKKKSVHKYNTPGWYDLTVSAVYVNSCTGMRHTEDMHLSICVIRPVIKYEPNEVCLPAGSAPQPNDTADIDLTQCQDTIVVPYNYYRNESVYEVPETVWSIGDTVIMGETVTRSGDLTVTIPGGNAVGCDSTVTYHVIIKNPLDFSVDTTSGTACYKDSLTLPFTYRKGDIGKTWLIDLDNNKRIDLDLANLLGEMSEQTSGEFPLPTHTFQPGYYKLQLHMEDYWAKELGLAQEEYIYPIDLTVYYPEDIFTYEFNNVLAVWKKGYGGNENWEFTEYQWFLNDEEIPGATTSVYHSEQPFTVGDIYYVLLTRRDGLVLRSCSQEIEQVDDYNEPANIPSKIIRNQQMLIVFDGVEYNIFGQRVQ